MKLLPLFLLVALVALNVEALDVGDSCQTDDECQQGGPDLVCAEKNSVKICKCKTGKKVSGTNQEGKTVCDFVYNSACSDDVECSDLEGADCEDGKCICKAGLLPDGPRCASVPTGTCTAKVHCITSLGDNAECKDKKCVCEEGFHQDTTNHKCVATKKLNDECMSHDDCYQRVGYDPKNVLFCEPSSRKCTCVEGYIPDGDKCSGASSLSVSLALLGAILFFRA